jgi:hypothetical protein
MTRLAIWLAAVLLGSAPALAEDASSPHEMLRADGQADTDKCGVCHNDDLTLSLSKAETCLLCHSQTEHAGAHEHLRADAAAVARLVPPPREGVPAFPLTDDGRMYCGTCHIFHDPRVSEEKVLDRAWVPSARLAQAVRDALTPRFDAAPSVGEKKAPAATFGDGTVRLRLPIADGSLCRHCHPWEK